MNKKFNFTSFINYVVILIILIILILNFSCIRQKEDDNDGDLDKDGALKKRHTYAWDDKHKGTSFISAVKNGRVELVKDLLDKGADPNQTDRRGKVAILFAINNNDFEMTEVLVNHPLTRMDSLLNSLSLSKKLIEDKKLLSLVAPYLDCREALGDIEYLKKYQCDNAAIVIENCLEEDSEKIDFYLKVLKRLTYPDDFDEFKVFIKMMVTGGHELSELNKGGYDQSILSSIRWRGTDEMLMFMLNNGYTANEELIKEFLERIKSSIEYGDGDDDEKERYEKLLAVILERFPEIKDITN